jgi:hypothetical protein
LRRLSALGYLLVSFCWFEKLMFKHGAFVVIDFVYDMIVMSIVHATELLILPAFVCFYALL